MRSHMEKFKFIMNTRMNKYNHKSRSRFFIQNISDHIDTTLDNMTKQLTNLNSSMISYHHKLEELASSKNVGNIQASFNSIKKNVITDHGISR